MESITMGWSAYSGGREDGIVAKISNCHQEIAKWRKIIHLMERKNK